MQGSSITENRMVFVPCNICGSSRYLEICDIEISPIFRPSKLVRCGECGFFYANPRPEKNTEEDYYRTHYHQDQRENYWYEARIDVFERLLREVKKFLKNGKLLDIGCGMGYFMELAGRNGWEARGVEISGYAASYARDKLGLKVIKGTFQDARLEKEYFDVATMWNVLDQAYDAKANLAESNRVLKKGGYIFLRMPNIDFHLRLSVFYNKLKRHLKGIKSSPAVFHLYSFDKNSIKKLLEVTGFSLVAVKAERLGENAPGLIEIFGKKREKAARKFFNLIGKALYLLSFKRFIISPSIFVVARKESDLRK